MKNRKDVVVGLGEIGLPILKLLSRSAMVVGYDINPRLMNQKKFDACKNLDTGFLHVCIPFSKRFLPDVKKLYKQFLPSCIVIHSTVSPYTTKRLQSNLEIPLIYSATRGVHKRMLRDLCRYTKFFALEKDAPKKKWASTQFTKLMRQCGIKTKSMRDPLTLELAKIICDTSYLGWLINYAQISNMIAKQHNVNFDEMWSFSDEIQKFLGNRPKMFPGYIGGHCVIPNLELINNQTLNLVEELNELYLKKIPNAKNIAKKYGSKLNR